MTAGLPSSDGPFSPRAFLRSRRPELFSDSVVEAKATLDRSYLEYHLEKLTSRSQEIDFEQFARKLAEKEICPNLIPHTGPTGGGDSKVDTETEPVADALALAWFVGIGREASKERWGFAFSAKEDWRAKVNSDIAKIAKTKRGYKVAYFISSRFIPDKLRADAEDTLTKKHKLKVLIRDRNWILDRIFSNGHVELAITELKLSPGLRDTVRKGPQDVAAEQELQEVEARITGAAQEKRFNLAYVDDCIEACQLSRNLERPRTESDGRFSRAILAAEKFGTQHQQLLVAYQNAWTTYWWHEDYAQFEQLYDRVEQLAKGTENPHDLELLKNLWSVSQGAQSHGQVTVPAEKTAARTQLLERELERVEKMPGRPSASLHAKALRLQMELFRHLRDKQTDQASATLKKLKGVVRECEGLVGFPLEPLIEIFSELGSLIGDLPAYDELFEEVVAVAQKRDGEVTAARLVIKRGSDQMRNGKIYEGIRTLGRALRQLYKHESRRDLVYALGLVASAYETVGLYWAARGTMLCAASVATREFWSYSDITVLQASCYQRLKWIELKLGRVPHVMAWHELDRLIRELLVQKGYDEKRIREDDYSFSAMLGVLFLRAELPQLPPLSRLPAALHRLGLDFAAVALYQALGRTERIPAELKEGKDARQLEDFFAKWRDQADRSKIQAKPQLLDQAEVELSSYILGCHVRVKCQNESPCVEIAESLLAALESFLATAGFDQLAAREPEITVDVWLDAATPFPLAAVASERGGRHHFDLTCPKFSPHNLTVPECAAMTGQLSKMLLQILARAFYVPNLKQTMERLVGNERALERALNYTASFITLGNVLGKNPKNSVAAWVQPGDADFPLKRSEVWDAAARRDLEKQRKPAEPSTADKPAGEKEPEGDPVGFEGAKHSEIENLSFIRLGLWSKARWKGAGFVVPTDNSEPPLLTLMFEDPVAGAEIFHHWVEELGREDREEKLRVSIIRGVMKSHPHTYRVLITANLEAAKSRPNAKWYVMAARMQTMEPASGENLRRFLEGYSRHRAFHLGYAQQPADPSKFTMPQGKNFIFKRQLNVREAWEIGRHDADVMAIQPGDDPIVPPDKKDAPVLETLAWVRERSAGKHDGREGKKRS